MRPTSLFAVAALSAALAAPTFAIADTYSLAHFSGGVFGGNANAQAPFGAAGITQGMALSGTFLIDNSIAPAPAGFDNIFYSNYADAAVILGSTDFSFNIGTLGFTADGADLAGIQYNNGHFNGFAYSKAFTFQNVGYTLSISGGTFSISDANFHNYVNGFINIGDRNVTGKTDFVPPPPAGTGPGVPEPASWALMIAGFGFTGAALRRRSARTA